MKKKVAAIASESPPPASRPGVGPLAFWFLNHDLDRAELSRQIGEMKEKGFSGFFLHPRGGLAVPYGSQAWNEIILFCVREARGRGMEAWLYDEDPYPSGNAGGKVTLEHPEYRATELVPTLLRVAEPGRVTLDLPEGALVAAYQLQNDRITRIDGAAGIVRSQWRQHLCASNYYPPYQSDGTPHWRAETFQPHYRIVLEITRPDTVLIAFTRRAIVQPPWGDTTDLLNPDAVQCFLDLTHRAYAALLGDECGATVPGIFTDEAKVRGLIPWSAGVPGWFREICGGDLMELLPHLVLPLNDRTPFFRWAFRKAIARGFREAFLEPMAETCAQHRLLLTGHFSPEEDPIGQVFYVPGLMGILGRMEIPGTDLIGSRLGSGLHPLLHLSPKIASSAAHGYGKKWVACEAFAVCDWSQDLAFMTRAIHWLYALGVNRLVTHGQYYSIDGLRKREAPPSQFIQASYWEHFGGFSAMVALLSRSLGEGTHVAPLLVYYPEESFMALASAIADDGDRATASAMRDSFGELIHLLLTSGYDFDLADEALLATAQANGHRVELSGETFDAILIPGKHLSPASWSRLQQLKASGVKLLFVEESMLLLCENPEPIPTEGLGNQGVLKALAALVQPLWKSKATLIGHQRATDHGPLLFLCNNGADDFSGPVHLNFPGPYEICHPQEGVWRKSEQPLHLELGAGLGILIRTPQPAPATGDTPKYLSWSERQPIDVEWGDWSVKPLWDNCLVLSEFRLLASSAYREALPPAQAFGGAPLIDLLSPMSLQMPLAAPGNDLFLCTSFDWHGPSAAVRLVCDTDLGVGEPLFYLNHKPLPPLTRRHTFDPLNQETPLTGLILPGRNHLLWVQRGPACPALPRDAIRLFGDFHATFPHGRPMPALLSRRPAGYHYGFPVPPSQIGHPHYGGIVEYETTFTLSAPLSTLPPRVSLTLGHVFESMELLLNGESIGHLWSPPHTVEVPRERLRSGQNRLTLRCSCSPANYLQALQRPGGFLGPVQWQGC